MITKITECSKECTGMLKWEDDVEAHALRKRGWTIRAIARHLRRDRKIICEYQKGNRRPGERAHTAPDTFAEYTEYCRIRWPTTRTCGRRR